MSQLSDDDLDHGPIVGKFIDFLAVNLSKTILDFHISLHPFPPACVRGQAVDGVQKYLGQLLIVDSHLREILMLSQSFNVDAFWTKTFYWISFKLLFRLLVWVTYLEKPPVCRVQTAAIRYVLPRCRMNRFESILATIVLINSRMSLFVSLMMCFL